jgi:hypothetical protein
MDEARAVMRRLERIELLDREHAHPRALLAELRALVHEAEEWVRAEGAPARAGEAVDRMKEAMSNEIVPA